MCLICVFYRKTAATGVPEVQTLATLKADLGLELTLETLCAAVSKVDDITLALGGSPLIALLAATTTVGWAGTLADAITSAATWNTANERRHGMVEI
jgi:hypothetical protein